MKYDVKQIRRDREEGMSIRKIADKHSISTTTVQKVLKREEQQNDIKQVINKIYEKSVSEAGISSSEEYSLLNSVGEKGSMRKVRSQCRRRAEKEGKECKFVPDWLYGRNARKKYNMMLQSANNVYERIQEEVDYLIQDINSVSDIPCLNRKELIHYLILLSTGNEGEVVKRCQQLDELVNLIDGSI